MRISDDSSMGLTLAEAFWRYFGYRVVLARRSSALAGPRADEISSTSVLTPKPFSTNYVNFARITRSLTAIPLDNLLSLSPLSHWSYNGLEVDEAILPFDTVV